MDFIHKKYTRLLIPVKGGRRSQSPVKKRKTVAEARFFKAFATARRDMDKTDDLHVETEDYIPLIIARSP